MGLAGGAGQSECAKWLECILCFPVNRPLEGVRPRPVMYICTVEMGVMLWFIMVIYDDDDGDIQVKIILQC